MATTLFVLIVIATFVNQRGPLLANLDASDRQRQA